MYNLYIFLHLESKDIHFHDGSYFVTKDLPVLRTLLLKHDMANYTEIWTKFFL